MARNIILLLTVLTALVVARPVLAGRVVERYEDGTMKADYMVGAEGRKHGVYRDFHPTGKIKIRTTYKNGKRYGLYTEFGTNGRPIAKGLYRDGALHGEYREWDERGRVKREAHYVEGKLHGKEKIFSEGRPVGMQVWHHGEALLNSLTAEQIHQKLKTIAAAPITGPGSADHKDAVRKVMAYRFLCGVPYEGIELDEQMNAEAQAAARLCERLGRLTHQPQTNPGLPADEFALGQKGASRSNLAMGQPTIAGTIDGYMSDAGASNIDRVGHRRWCLNPQMGKVGFGKSGRVSAMWVFDRSRRDVPDWDVIAYPPRGFIPARYFGRRHPWSVSLNTRRTEKPDPKAIKVKVWAAVGRQTIDLAKTRAAEPLTLNFFHVDTGGYGAGPTIIFRPDHVDGRAGERYWVEIEGIKTRDGRAWPLRYLVAFIE